MSASPLSLLPFLWLCSHSLSLSLSLSILTQTRTHVCAFRTFDSLSQSLSSLDLWGGLPRAGLHNLEAVGGSVKIYGNGINSADFGDCGTLAMGGGGPEVNHTCGGECSHHPLNESFTCFDPDRARRDAEAAEAAAKAAAARVAAEQAEREGEGACRC